MNSKQECIAKAYGEYWEYFKDKVDSDGWIKDRDFWGSWPENMNKINWQTTDHDNDYYDTRRPLELKGIEKNNGWIKIENEDDLPEQGGSYYVTRYGKIETAVYVKNNRWLVNGNDYPKTTIRHSITHYQPIIKPEPPLH